MTYQPYAKFVHCRRSIKCHSWVVESLRFNVELLQNVIVDIAGVLQK